MDESMLITLVELHPNIFDKKRGDFKDARKKENSWSEIALGMGSTPQDCQRVWLNLRTRYSKELRKRNEVPSGAASQVEEEGRWALFNNLHFLQTHINPRKTSSNVQKATVPASASSSCSTSSSSSMTSMWDTAIEVLETSRFDEELAAEQGGDEENAPGASSTPLAHIAPRRLQDAEGAPARKKKKIGTSGLEEKLSTTAEALSTFLLKDKTTMDPNDAFAYSVASSLKEMSRSNRNKAKIEIMEILAKYDVEHDVIY